MPSADSEALPDGVYPSPAKSAREVPVVNGLPADTADDQGIGSSSLKKVLNLTLLLDVCVFACLCVCFCVSVCHSG